MSPFSKTQKMFAVTVPGLEPALAMELEQINASDIHQVPGGVEFSGDTETLYRSNLWLRTAGRILVRLDQFFTVHLAKLHKRAATFEWEQWVDKNKPISVKATCHKSKLYHSVAVAQRVAKGIAEKLGLHDLPKFGEGAPDEDGVFPTVLVRIYRDHCIISLDSSGEHLHRRGYRTKVVDAPLRENLAAAVLLLSSWQKSEPLADPMCGSGTIPIEAALFAANIAPGMQREFAFMHWKAYDARLWTHLLNEAKKCIRMPKHKIYASDISQEAVEIAKYNAERAGVLDIINIERKDARDFTGQEQQGLIICNPPYGKRIGERRQLRSFYASLGKMLHSQPPHWRLAFITSDQHFAASTSLPFDVVTPAFPNGGVRVKLYCTSVVHAISHVSRNS